MLGDLVALTTFVFLPRIGVRPRYRKVHTDPYGENSKHVLYPFLAHLTSLPDREPGKLRSCGQSKKRVTAWRLRRCGRYRSIRIYTTSCATQDSRLVAWERMVPSLLPTMLGAVKRSRRRPNSSLGLQVEVGLMGAAGGTLNVIFALERLAEGWGRSGASLAGFRAGGPARTGALWGRVRPFAASVIVLSVYRPWVSVAPMIRRPMPGPLVLAGGLEDHIHVGQRLPIKITPLARNGR